MKSLEISISFANEPGVAGQHLRGQVHLNATKAIPAQELVLMLNGQEETHVTWTEWTTEQGSNNREQRTRTDTGHRSFWAVKIPVETFAVIQQGNVLPGQYDVPFDVELPEHIPTSFRVDSGESHCFIKYELKVQLRGSGKLWDYKETKQVKVIGKS